MPSLPDTPSTTDPAADLAWDVTRKYVREVAQHDNGMVEFEFAVGEPSLFVEMVMPRPAFEEFCAMHGVQPTQGRLPPSQNMYL